MTENNYKNEPTGFSIILWSLFCSLLAAGLLFFFLKIIDLLAKSI
jgi:hypothetical protein